MICPSVIRTCLHYYPLLVPQPLGPPQEASLSTMKTETNTSGIPQLSASSVTSRGSAATGTSQVPAKPTGNTQALNGTSSLPASKFPAVGSTLFTYLFRTNSSYSHQHSRPAIRNRVSRGVEVIYVVGEVHIRHLEEARILEVEEVVHNVVEQISTLERHHSARGLATNTREMRARLGLHSRVTVERGYEEVVVVRHKCC